MATLTLQVDADLLARAEAAAKSAGTDVESQLLRKLEELGSREKSGRSEQFDAVRRMIEISDANPAYLEGGMPSREERNARG
ncbi:MAG: hypothetical protein PW792_13475 [Acidobacteriaceae bacterium]|nr:hypothetical protein [Acidobacteriaceae bacterium]